MESYNHDQHVPTYATIPRNAGIIVTVTYMSRGTKLPVFYHKINRPTVPVNLINAQGIHTTTNTV